jgi:hypothetical protein
MPEKRLTGFARKSRQLSTSGLPDFYFSNVLKRGKTYQIATKFLTGHKIYQMAVIYSKWSWNVPTFIIPRPSKIYQNLDFWFEN